MEIWFIILLANIVIIILLFYSKIYIGLQYKRDGSNDFIAVDVYMFRRLVAYNMQVPMIKMGDINSPFWLKSKIKTGQSQDETHIKREQRFIKKNVKFYLLHPRKLRRVIRLVNFYKGLYCKVMGRIIHSSHCEELYWKTIFGSEDAAITGIGTGTLWTVKALMITRLKNRVIVTKQPIVTVKPIFGNNRFNVDFQCIFSIRLGNVINAMKMLYLIKQ